MRKFLLFFTFIVAITLFSVAQNSNNRSSRPIVLKSHPINNRGGSTRHRAPIRIAVDCYYNSDDSSIHISYDGDDEVEGEVLFYLDECLIGHSFELNASFPVSIPGQYKIEIISESWAAFGYIELN